MRIYLAGKRGTAMRKGLSQEGLKLVACITMLIDHIGYEIIYSLYRSAAASGAAFLQTAQTLNTVYYLCRCVGRIALPIFAFLIVEGAHHTRNKKKYALRLIAGAVLAEIPFNLLVHGSVLGSKQSVMVTLLLGYLAVLIMDKCRALAWKPVAAIPFAITAELLNTDYGWYGVVLVALFDLSRYMPRKNLIRVCAMLVLAHYRSGMMLQLGNFSIPMQALSALAMLFIANYDGRKLTRSKAAQWAFYLFYPVHMLILWLIGLPLSGVFTWGVTIV